MAGLNTVAHGAPNAAPACATTPTLADLGVSTATVYKICKSGELPHIRIVDAIRVRPVDLSAFIAKCRAPDCGPDGGGSSSGR